MNEYKDDKVYTATIQFLSRGQCRGGIYWSTKRCREVLKAMGYDMSPGLKGQPVDALIQEVTFTGTREEILEHRKKITGRLQGISSRRIGIKFEMSNKENNHDR